MALFDLKDGALVILFFALRTEAKTGSFVGPYTQGEVNLA
jgi:hypothetical protein